MQANDGGHLKLDAVGAVWRPNSLSSRSAPLRPRRWLVVTQVGMVTNAINIVVCWHFHKDLALRGLGYLSALFLVQNFQEK